MTRTEYLLTCLAEECIETAQRATKAIRFGINEVQAGQQFDNAERICLEYNDIQAVMEVLGEELGWMPEQRLPHLIKRKKEKLKEWMAYSEKMGALTEKGEGNASL